MSAKLPAGGSSGPLPDGPATFQSEVLDCSHWESDIPDDQWSTGQLVGEYASFEVVTLDCSHWESDIPDDQWSTGQLIGVCGPLEVVTGDFNTAPDDDAPEPLEPSPVPHDADSSHPTPAG